MESPKGDVAYLLLAAKRDAETQAARLKIRIDRARRSIERSEARLARLDSELARRVAEITSTFLEIPIAAPPLPKPRRRAKKFSLDESVLALIRRLPSPVVTVPQIADTWNKEHPESQIGRTSMRVILDRLADPEEGVLELELEIVDPGSPGRRKMRNYRLRNVHALPDEPGADVEEEVPI